MGKILLLFLLIFGAIFMFAVFILGGLKNLLLKLFNSGNNTSSANKSEVKTDADKLYEKDNVKIYKGSAGQKSKSFKKDE